VAPRRGVAKKRFLRPMGRRFTRSQWPHLNSAFIAAKENFRLQPGKTLKLTYAILIQNAPADADALERTWKTFAAASKMGSQRENQ